MKIYLSILVLFTQMGLASYAVSAEIGPGRLPAAQSQAAADTLPATVSKDTPPDMAQVNISQTYGKLPLSFEANQGQSNKEVEFISRGQGYILFLTPTEAVLRLSKAETQGEEEKSAKADKGEDTVVRLQLLGANAQPEMLGLDKLLGKSNYLIGRDPEKWRTAVPHYLKVRYQAVYPGIDMVYYGNQRELEYDFVVAPGADPQAIKLAFQGVDKIKINPRGDLILDTHGEQLVQRKPLIYQEISGKRRVVAGSYVLKDKQVGFQIAGYDTQKPLIIDPVLAYSTYLGGSEFDTGRDIPVDSDGNAYVAGSTLSTDFPTTSGAFDRTCSSDGLCRGGRDGYILKLNAAGDELIYATYIGGTGFDRPRDIDIDGAGNAYIAGWTDSRDFPVTANAHDALCGSDGTCNGGKFDVFVARLNAQGNGLDYSSYLGGSGGDLAASIAVDNVGNAYVTGHTSSADFPTVRAYDTTCGTDGTCDGGESDAFIARFNTNKSGDASLVYSTYLGGIRRDQGLGIGTDNRGNAYVSGLTDSRDFPTLNPLQTEHGGSGTDAFVAKLDTRASGAASLIYSTYLGGSGFDRGAFGVAIDGAGHAYVTGYTDSIDFPTANPLQPALAGRTDAFVAKLSPDGSRLIYSTYLGGSELERGFAIAIDSSGSAYVVGETHSSDFPTTRAVQPHFGGVVDVYMAKLNAAGNRLINSTYLGGSDLERAFGVTVDHCRNVYVMGEVTSTDFPTTPGALQTVHGGARLDAFATKIVSSAVTTLQFSSLNYRVNEGRGEAIITVTRCGGVTDAVSVDYATSDGTATASSDYTATSGVLIFDAGDAAHKQFTISIIDDSEAEPDETVNITLSNPNGGAVLKTRDKAVLTITDND